MIRLRTDIGPKSEEQRRIMARQLAISMKWDNEETPSVWAPLGDFWGAPGIKPYRSLPLGMNEHEMYSYWYLPFSEGARIEMKMTGRRHARFRLRFGILLYPSLMRRTSCVFIPNGIGMIIWIWIRSASRETEIAGRIGLCR